METSMTEKPTTREEAIAIVKQIQERWVEACEELIRMPKPDAAVVKHFRNPSHSRRFARRLRAGIARPTWMTEAPEELARKHEHAAEYVLKIREVGRLSAAYKRAHSQIANEAFAGVREIFDRMKERHVAASVYL
jgi:hypothetical protein